MSESLPLANQRLKSIISDKAGGNVSQFISLFTKEEQEVVYQQRIDRLLKKAGNANKYPIITQDILEVILNRFPDVDAHWLITGKEKSGDQKPPDSHLLTLIENYVASARLSLDELSKAIVQPLGPGTNAHPHLSQTLSKSDRKNRRKKPEGT
jgi:hypothetical protein